MTILSSTQPMQASDAGASAAAGRAPAADRKAEALFQASLGAAERDGSASAAGSAAGAASISAIHQSSKSGILTPVQQFESFVLRSFVETMLPQENTSFFGTGTAGQIWKSMLAERIGDEMAKDGGIGIAELLSERGTPQDPPLKAAQYGLAPAGGVLLGVQAARENGPL